MKKLFEDFLKRIMRMQGTEAKKAQEEEERREEKKRRRWKRVKRSRWARRFLSPPASRTGMNCS